MPEKLRQFFIQFIIFFLAVFPVFITGYIRLSEIETHFTRLVIEYKQAGKPLDIVLADYEKSHRNFIFLYGFLILGNALLALFITLTLNSFFKNKRHLKEYIAQIKKLNEKLERKIIEKTFELQEKVQQLERANKAILNVAGDLEESRAKEEHEKIKIGTIIKSIGEGLIVMDEHGIITMLNKAAEELLGIAQKELVGQRFEDSIEMENEKGVPLIVGQHPVRRVLISNHTPAVSGKYTLVLKNRDKIPIFLTAALVRNKGTTGVVGVFRDISQEQVIEKTRSEFVSLASHQLRTPITAVKLFSEMLIDEAVGPLNAKQKQYLSDIVISIERMVKLIEDLLSVSRIDSERLKIQREIIDIESFMKSIVKEIKNVADQRGCTIDVKQTCEEKSTRVFIDQKLLRQVVSNLIMNAVNYADKEKEKRIIDILITCATNSYVKKIIPEKSYNKILPVEKFYVIHIKDNGIGIPKKDHYRIFEKFFRTDIAIKTIPDGSGLGLYIAKLLTEAMGGTLTFESEEKKGSTFYVILPMVEDEREG
ncbi:MAG: ATP-binding protein [bacterium]|nr:ATP-binding protein [bacterium]